MKTNSLAWSRSSLAAPTWRRRVSILVAGLAGLLVVGCKQGAGERCQVASDCGDGLTCQSGCLNPAPGAVCQCTAIESSTGTGGVTVPPTSSGGTPGTAGTPGAAGGTGQSGGAAGDQGAGSGGAAGGAGGAGGTAGGGGAVGGSAGSTSSSGGGAGAAGGVGGGVAGAGGGV